MVWRQALSACRRFCCVDRLGPPGQSGLDLDFGQCPFLDCRPKTDIHERKFRCAANAGGSDNSQAPDPEVRRLLTPVQRPTAGGDWPMLDPMSASSHRPCTSLARQQFHPRFCRSTGLRNARNFRSVAPPSECPDTLRSFATPWPPARASVCR